MYNECLMKRVLLILASCMCVLTSSLRSTAQTDTGRLQLTTSPLPISLVATPGTTVTTELRVKNGGLSKERVKISLLKFNAYGEEGQPRLMSREPGDEYFDWVKFSEGEFDALPNVWKTIKMTIAVPKDAAFGYYYAVTFARANPVKADKQETTVEGATATLVLLEAKVPGATKKVELRQFSVPKQYFEATPINFTIKLHNSGNVHVAPSGTIFVMKGDKDIATIDVNTVKGNILPDSNRIFTVSWENDAPEIDGKKVDRHYFGKFKANLVLAYDDGSKDVPIEASVEFWMIPWKYFLIRGAMGLFILIGVFSTFRIMTRNIKRKKRGKT